jgi:diacylglycerol kinase (ATP)
MKQAKLLHNTTAGEEDHEPGDLLEQIQSNGFGCSYSSTKKKELKKLKSGFDFLVAAGGDGTIRKITRSLLKREHLEKPWPVALLPLGTANNIAKTLGLEGETEDLIRTWHNAQLQPFDVGDVYHNKNEVGFFLESFGFGIFPRLMKEGRKEKIDENPGAEERILAALKLLYRIICSYKPKYCEIIADGKDLSGKFLMMEVMNAKSIGPNLLIAPNADPGDGKFEVVFIPEERREDLAAYVQHRIDGREMTFEFPMFQAAEISLKWNGTDVHMDDELIKQKKSNSIFIRPRRGLLEFMVPGN